MGLFVLADLFKEIKPIHALDDTYIHTRQTGSILIGFIQKYGITLLLKH